MVSVANPDTAAEEIERLAADKRFVQVLVLAMGEAPSAASSSGRSQGRRALRPADRHPCRSMFATPRPERLPVLSGRRRCHAVAWFHDQVLSLIAEGVFVEFPGLRVVLIESGVSWMPSLMWRATKDWRGARIKIPGVKTPRQHHPRALPHDHAAVDAPPDPADLERL